MLIGFMLICSTVKMFAERTPEPTNPFTAFSDIFPRQSSAAAIARGFTCHQVEANTHYAIHKHCTKYLTTGTFSQIALLISSGDTIDSTTFMIRDDRLKVGDMGLWLGVIFDQYLGHGVSVQGQETFRLNLSRARPVSPFRIVHSVIFTDHILEIVCRGGVC
ncbi:MAG: hypothetical protein R3E39_11835 [Anaerolineae bacterium]